MNSVQLTNANLSYFGSLVLCARLDLLIRFLKLGEGHPDRQHPARAVQLSHYELRKIAHSNARLKPAAIVDVFARL